jgi:hypothetical protein
MKTDAADLVLIAMVINEKGFSIIEGIIRKQLIAMNDLEGVTGDTFMDGILKGQSTGRKMDLLLFDNLRKEIKKNNKEDK